jgi:DNA-binding response OmpR family regulator
LKTILLIEDNKDILENLTEFLEMEGYKIITAIDGKKGLELAIELIPDLIICDFKMPEMNGYQVLEALIDTVKTHEIPFIFSTSMSEQVDKEKALQLGADEYIVKPFNLDTLLEMTKTLLKSGSKRQF